MVGGNQRNRRREQLRFIVGTETDIVISGHERSRHGLEKPILKKVEGRGTIEFRDKDGNPGYYIKGSENAQIYLALTSVSPSGTVFMDASGTNLRSLRKYEEALANGSS